MKSLRYIKFPHLVYLNKILGLLSKRHKTQLKIIAIFALLSSFIESFSIGLILPILSFTLGSQAQLFEEQNNFIISLFYKIFFGKSPILIILTFIIFTLISTIIKIFNQNIIARYSAAVIKDIDNKIFRTSIIRPYNDFLNDHSSNSSSAIITKSTALMATIRSLLDILISFIGGLFIVATLFIINWKITILTFLIILSSYVLIGNFFNKKIKNIGKQIARLESKQIKIVQDSYSNTKNILLNDNFHIYYELFKNINSQLRISRSLKSVFSIATRYLLEAIIITIASLIILYSALNIDISFKLISYLTILFFGIQKLLPYMQLIYNGWVNVKLNKKSVEDVIEIINNKIKYSDRFLNTNGRENLFQNFQQISFKNISFKYLREKRLILNNINFKINRGDYIGIAGGSGAGKSTLINILLGLQIPNNGELLIDKKNIFQSLQLLKSWQKKISYVSQDINLLSSTVLFNICEEIDSTKIDLDRVNYCIRAARLSNLIEKLPKGIYSEIGEKGIQLSGGEKQRLAIGRSLYKKSSLLILDEATSSLDPDNESAIIKIIKDIKSQGLNITIIAIAHRYSTLKDCDKIYYLNKGNIQKISFDNLIKSKQIGKL
mgnify:CR=1 FL=1